MKQGNCWLCGRDKKVMQTTVDGHHRWLCKKCAKINQQTMSENQAQRTEVTIAVGKGK